MRWYRIDIYNVTCNCTIHMILAGRTHYNAMLCIIDYCMTTPERGLVLKQHCYWDGISTDYKFEVTVKTQQCKMPRYKKKHDRKCGLPEWNAGNV